MTAGKVVREAGGESVRQIAKLLGAHERTMYKIHETDPDRLRLLVRRALYRAGKIDWRDELARLGGADQSDDDALAAIQSVAFITAKEDPTQ